MAPIALIDQLLVAGFFWAGLKLDGGEILEESRMIQPIPCTRRFPS